MTREELMAAIEAGQVKRIVINDSGNEQFWVETVLDLCDSDSASCDSVLLNGDLHLIVKDND